MYRLQVHDPRTTGMHWQIGKGGGFHYAAAEAKGEALPVTVFLGGPPALILAAVAPLPENVPELMLASLIAGQRLPTCPGPGGEALVAEAEFALIGSVPPKVRRPEGPFGDHYGYYSLRHDYPVFEVSHLARRRTRSSRPPSSGKPRQEDFFIGDLLQELLSPLFPLVMPAVTRLWSYGETGYHSLAAAVVKQRYKREAMASAFRILGEGQLSLTKFLIVLDREVDLTDFKAVLTHLLERTVPETDLFVFSNVSMDTLDYTGPSSTRARRGCGWAWGAGAKASARVSPAVALPDARATRACSARAASSSAPHASPTTRAPPRASRSIPPSGLAAGRRDRRSRKRAAPRRSTFSGRPSRVSSRVRTFTRRRKRSSAITSRSHRRSSSMPGSSPAFRRSCSPTRRRRPR
jgi:3-polyprenyl-4-hydroxybenzoate decarboxylase